MTPVSAHHTTRSSMHRLRVGLLSAFLLVCFGWPLLTFAETDSDTATNSKLEQLREQIQSLRHELDSDQQRKQGLQTQLRNTERHIGKVVALLKRLKRQLRKQQRELKKLRKRRGGLQSDLQAQRVSLAQQIRAAYSIGQQEYVKICSISRTPRPSPAPSPITIILIVLAWRAFKASTPASPNCAHSSKKFRARLKNSSKTKTNRPRKRPNWKTPAASAPKCSPSFNNKFSLKANVCR